MKGLLRIGTKVRTFDRGARVHGRPPDKPEAIGTIQDHHRPFGRQSKDRTPPYYVTFETGESAWYDAPEVERLRGLRSCHHATRTIRTPREGRPLRIRKGSLGRIVNADNNQRAAFFDGARARVQQRLYRPDSVIVELLDDGPGWPGGTWHRGTIGELRLRYFIPDQGRERRSGQAPESFAANTQTHATRKTPPAQLEREIAEALARSPGPTPSSAFEEAKAENDLIEREVDAASAALQTFPKGPMGGVRDDVRATPEFQAADARFKRAFARLRAFNAIYVKRFAKELRAERDKRYGR